MTSPGRRPSRRRAGQEGVKRPPSQWAPRGSEHPARARRGTPARRVTAWRGRRRRRRRQSGSRVAESSARHSTRDAALADGGDEPRRVEPLGDAVGQAEDLQRGDRHHDRAAVGDLLEASWRCCRAARRTCRSGRTAASWARRRTEPVATVAPDASSAEGRADERVGGIAPGAERADRRGRRGCRRQVLGRVHGDVGATVEHRLLDLLDEHALAADRVQRRRLIAVAGRLDEHELGRSPGQRRDRRRRRRAAWVARLRAPAGGQPERPAAGARQLSRGRRGRSPRRRCARPAACRRRGAGAPTARAAAWRRSTG